MPYLDYCSLVWSGTSSKNLTRLFVPKKKAIRLCTNSNYLAHSSPLFKEVHNLTIHDRISFKLGVFVFKFLNGLLPHVFTDYFVQYSQTHTFNTRKSDNFVLPFCRLHLTQSNSIQFKGAKFWNSFDSSIKNLNSISNFKSQLKKHFLSLY